jgi:hypothetical protein
MASEMQFLVYGLAFLWRTTFLIFSLWDVLNDGEIAGFFSVKFSSQNSQILFHVCTKLIQILPFSSKMTLAMFLPACGALLHFIFLGDIVWFLSID